MEYITVLELMSLESMEPELFDKHGTRVCQLTRNQSYSINMEPGLVNELGTRVIQ